MIEPVNPKIFNEQISFINELVKRLKIEIDSSVKTVELDTYYFGKDKEGKVHTLPNHYRIQQDIKRIRRDLQDLSNMLNW